MTPLADCTAPSDAPVFILSAERSGSTLLRYVLDTHPEVYSPDELYLARVGYMVANFLDGAHARELPALTSSSALLSDLSRQQARQFIDGVFAEAMKSRGKRIWCEKCPLNLDSVNLLELLFADARYVCLYRHPVDYVHSVLQSCPHGFYAGLLNFIRFQPDNLIQALAMAWIDKTHRLLEVERSATFSSMRVRYEDLVTRPEQVLAEIETYLGLRHAPEILDRVFTADHSQRFGAGDEKIRYSTRIELGRLGLGRQLPWPYRISPRVRRELTELMLELGYPELPQEGQDYSLGVEPTAPPQQVGPATVRQFFEQLLPAALEAQDGAPIGISSRIRFHIDGDDGGDWLLQPGVGGRPEVATQGEAETTFSAATDTFLKILSAELNPMEAVMTGKLQAEGVQNVDEMQKVVFLLLRAASASSPATP